MHKIILILLTLFTTNSFAAELVNLYQSELPVANQEEQERQRVAPDILRQVLLKVVGDREAINATDLTPLLSQVDRLIQQYQYRRLNEITDDLTQPDQLALSLKFNETALNQALREMSLPMWSKIRPDVLVWLAIDDGNTRRIISADDVEKNYRQALNNAADRRGLPLILPIMDLQDHSQLAVADLWAGFAGPVEQASQRYAAKIILMASATVASNGTVQIRWQSLVNGQSEQWQTKGDVNTAIQLGIDEITDRLARRFTQVVTASAQQAKSAIEISNVKSYGDYARVMAYLARLQYVSDIQIVSFEEDKLTVSLSITGDKTVFNRTLAIEQVLQEESNIQTSDTKQYRLVP